MLATTRAAAVLACCMAVSVAACRWRPAALREETVGWRDAAQCVGRVCAVSGTVAVTENDGPAIRLYFDPQQRDVCVLLMRGWLLTWPRYDGETIVATGKVQRFREHVEVAVLDPSDVVVLGATPSPTPTLASAATLAPASTPGEVEELRQRVHELEQRVRELEGR